MPGKVDHRLAHAIRIERAHARIQRLFLRDLVQHVEPNHRVVDPEETALPHRIARFGALFVRKLARAPFQALQQEARIARVG